MFRISLPVLIFKSNSAYFDENEYHCDIYHSLLKSNVTDILIVPCYSYKNNPFSTCATLYAYIYYLKHEKRPFEVLFY